MNVAFFNADWKFFGTKSGLLGTLSITTHIDKEALRDARDLSRFSIAKRMSWASGRQATRKEDVAYSLLGIFDVNMPLLYGEGNKAFLRLQEHIMKDSDDQSLLAWGGVIVLDLPNATSFLYRLGFFASSPEDFAGSADVLSFTTERDDPWTLTNKGIQIHFDTLVHGTNTIILLNCYVERHLDMRIGLLTIRGAKNQRVRASKHPVLVSDRQISTSKEVQSRSSKGEGWVFTSGIRQFLSKSHPDGLVQGTRPKAIFVKPQSHYKIVQAWPEEQWDKTTRVFRPPLDYASKWSVLLDIILTESHSAARQRADSHIIIKLEVSHDSSSCDLIHTHRSLSSYLQQHSYHYIFPQEAPQSSMTSTGSVRLANDLYLRASMENKDVMGAPMFVLDITESTNLSIARDGIRHLVKGLVTGSAKNDKTPSLP